MHLAETRIEARRELEICNACRFCEGFCAVFPALELRRAFSDGELDYLANLCHGCRGCYYACQYAPPHEFAVNLPRALAELRAETYAGYAWPRPMARLFERNGIVVSLAIALGIALAFLPTVAWHSAEVLFGVHREPGAFYEIVSYGTMVTVASATLGFALLAMAVGASRFWRGTESGPLPAPRALWRGLRDVLTLRNLGGGGDGCNDRDEGFSQSRRRFHHALFYGFALCFASTCVAAVYEHVLGELAPYPFLSLPVLLGTVGGIGMTVGAGGLGWLKLVGDSAPASPSMQGADAALLFLLGMTAVTGLLLLGLRGTPAMGLLLAAHLGFVLALFLVMPYCKFVHGVYRAAALLRNAREQQAAAAPH
jgi:citrate/tricarballylate utilization protein